MYLVVVVVVSFHHEVWRDEVRVLSIVRASDSVAELFENLRTEGHPLLWYLVVYFGVSLVDTPLVLQVASLAIALLAVMVFIRRSPFPLVVRALFPFGFLPVFEYSVMSRNYGLGMLFAFLYCAAYPRRLSHPLRAGSALFLLAHTSIFGTIMTMAAATALALEEALRRRTAGGSSSGVGSRSGDGERRPGPPWTLLLLPWAGAGLALLQMYPHPESMLTSVHHDAAFLSDLVRALGEAILAHGRFTASALMLGAPMVVPAVLVLLYLMLARKPELVVLLLSVVVGMEVVRVMVYPYMNLRHQGNLLLAIVVVLWLDRIAPPSVGHGVRLLERLEPHRVRLLTVGATVLLCLQVWLGWQYVVKDLGAPLSSAKALAELISGTPELRDAILMFEPDSRADTMPYYVDNPIFMPREQRFARWFSATTRSGGELTLEEVVQTALELRQTHGRHVLVMLPLHLRPGRIPVSYGRSFTVSSDGLAALQEHARHLMDFDRSPSSEVYAAYLF